LPAGFVQQFKKETIIMARTEEEIKAADKKEKELAAQKAQIEKDKDAAEAVAKAEFDKRQKAADEATAKASAAVKPDEFVILECTYANGLYPKAFAKAGLTKGLRFRNNRASCKASEVKFLQANKQWGKEYGLAGEFKLRRNPSVEVIRM